MVGKNMIEEILDWIWDNLAYILLIINIILGLTIIYLNRRYPTTTMMWVAFLAIIPIVGFIFFILFGHT